MALYGLSFPILAPYGTAAAPQYAASGSPSSGFYIANDNTSSVTRGGTQIFYFGAGNCQILPVAASLTFYDTVLFRDGAANTLALRNSTNANTFRVYETYTDASNYSRLNIGYSSGAGAYQILSDALGTGSARQLHIGTNVNASVTFLVHNTARWSINTSGHFVAGTDASYDIGQSGATRPRNIYASNTILASAGSIGWASKALMQSPSDGIITLFNAAVTDFTRLQFGGTTSSFPALKRNGTQIDVRLADDSAYASLVAAYFTSTGDARIRSSTAIPAGGTAGFGYLATSATNFGVFFGSGAPTLSAAKGSLYLRSDGSTVNDRMYVNTDAGTTWTAVVTAA